MSGSRSVKANRANAESTNLMVLAVGNEMTASTRFRVLAYLSALKEAGYSTSVVFQAARPTIRLMRLPLRLRDELADLRRASSSDLLLVQRRCYPPLLTPLLRRRGRPMLFDFDDAIFLPSPSESQTGASLRRYRRNFDATASAADMVLCGNSELAGSVPYARTTVLPTAVDCERFHPESVAPVQGQTVGWVGHSGNLDCLEAIAGPLREIARRYPLFKLVVVSDREPRLEGVPVEFRRWTLEGETDNLRGIGIGLMPLGDSPWTRGKCAFKLLQYMALGLPSIASPVGMNREVIETGENGLLASSDDEWVGCLDLLLRRSDLRQRLGQAGRRTVMSRYDLPLVSRRLVAVLEGMSGGPRRQFNGAGTENGS